MGTNSELPNSPADLPNSLVDRLRAWVWLSKAADGGWGLPPNATEALHKVCHKAADEIERLQAENQRLRAENAVHFALRARREYQWQPIESAPRDGTRVLVIFKQWPDAFVSHWDRTLRGWWHTDPFLNSYTPTHWMPLPPPPTE